MILTYETVEKTDRASAAYIEYLIQHPGLHQQLSSRENLRLSGKFHRAAEPEKLLTMSVEELLDLETV